MAAIVHHESQKSEGRFSELVSILKYAMNFQDPGQKGEVTPQAHIQQQFPRIFPQIFPQPLPHVAGTAYVIIMPCLDSKFVYLNIPQCVRR